MLELIGFTLCAIHPSDGGELRIERNEASDDRDAVWDAFLNEVQSGSDCATIVIGEEAIRAELMKMRQYWLQDEEGSDLVEQWNDTVEEWLKSKPDQWLAVSWAVEYDVEMTWINLSKVKAEADTIEKMLTSGVQWLVDAAAQVVNKV